MEAAVKTDEITSKFGQLDFFPHSAHTTFRFGQQANRPSQSKNKNKNAGFFVFETLPLSARAEPTDIRYFHRWMRGGGCGSVDSIVLAPYKNCPIAGASKYQLFRLGCESGLSPGLCGRFKKHRQRRLRNSFFQACSDYWCVRRCIVRWKHRRMKERSGMEILSSGEGLSTVPTRMWYSLIDGNEKYTFYLRDLVRLIHERLLHSEFFVTDPQQPINPLTGTVLTDNQVACILMRCVTLHVALPWSLVSFWKLKFNLSEFVSTNFVCLNEIAIRNEAYSLCPELLDDIEAMYDSLDLEDIRPDINDARRLNLVTDLIKTHQGALHSFYLAQRSLCRYTQEMAQHSLVRQCRDAGMAYHKKTHLALLHDCIRSTALSAEVAPSPQTPPHPRPFPQRIPITNEVPVFQSNSPEQLSWEAYDTAGEADSP